MLFLVLLSDEPEFNELRHALREDRQAYLDSIAQSGRLLAEGAFADGGNLMVIEAGSPGDAIALLQGDPYVVQPVSNRIQIRPLQLNFVAPAIAQQDGGSGIEGSPPQPR
jgi:uncharacterized protein YciI